MRIQVALQDYGGSQIIHVTAPFTKRDTHGSAGGAGYLGAVAFIPQDDRQVGLGADGFGQAGGAAALGGLVALGVKRLTDNNQSGSVLGSQLGNVGGIDWTSYMAQHRQRVSDNASGVAQSDPQVFLSRVNSQNTHGKSLVIGW